jgi:hypothetical protein
MKQSGLVKGIAEPIAKYAVVFAVIFALSQTACNLGEAADREVSPGQWINLTGPTPPANVAYSYLWSVQTPQGGAEVTLRNSTSENVQKNLQNLKFYAPYYGTDTVLYINLFVSARKLGGSTLEGCAQNAAQVTVEIKTPTDNDLTGQTGDHCTSTPSTYTFTASKPGLTYEWYLGPIGISPATTLITSYTGGITPASVSPTTSSITINWDSLVPSLMSGNDPVPPKSGTFTVSLNIKEAGVVKQTISKTVTLVPKPIPQVSFE